MTTKELIEAKIQHLDNQQLEQLYQVIQTLPDPETSNSSSSLMSKLKQIRIDGPEDFAANFEWYADGEKRVG